MTWFAIIYQYLADPLLVLALIPFVFHIMNPRIGLKLSLMNSIVVYVQSLLIILYGEPRPYWISYEIQGLTCKKGFGNPSLTISICFSCHIFLCGHIKNQIIRLIALTCCVLYLISLVFIEAYLGNHFFH